MKLSLTKYFFNFLVIVLLTHFSFLQVYSQDTIPKKQERKHHLIVGVNNQIVTKYVPKVGIQIGEGYADQSLINLSYAGFSVFAWGNYGFPENGFTGVIYGIQHKHKFPLKSEKVIYSGKLAVHNYIFPDADLSNWVGDYCFTASGRIKTSLQYSHVFSDERIDHGDRLFGIINFPVKYKLYKIESVLSPNISTAYHWNFYGRSGLAHLTFGLKNNLTFGRFSTFAYVNYQHSFESIRNLFESGFYGGLGIAFSKKFK